MNIDRLDEYIINLRDCYSYPKTIIGGKAFWLGKIYGNFGQNIPKGICISTELFNKFMNEHPKNNTIMDLLSEVKSNRIMLRRNFALIKEIIINSSINNKVMGKIIKHLEAAGINLKQGIAVRSSATNEDSQNKNYAGVYNTTLNVNNEIDLENAILETWASLFSEVIYFYEQENYINQKMAILIQPMVRGEHYGVLFSHSPINFDNVLLEISNGTTDIVEGYSPLSRIEIPREGKFRDFNLDALKNIAIKIENIIKNPVDMEWAVNNGKVIILQCRPAKIYEPISKDIIAINEDDISKYGNINMKNCNEMYNRYLGKQQIFRTYSKLSGFDTYNRVYFFLNKDNIKNLTENYIKKFINTKFVMIDYGDRHKRIFCSYHDIQIELICLLSMGYECCRVEEIIDPLFSGYCSLTKDDSIYIEYVPGGMIGMIKGLMVPTSIIIDNKFNIECIKNPIYDKISKFNFEKFLWERDNYGKRAEKIPKFLLEQIIDYTKKLSNLFKNPRLEWYATDSQIIAKDVSVEGNAIEVTDKKSDIISSGIAIGKAYFLDDLKKFDEIASKYNISLVAHSDEEKEVKKDLLIKNTIEELSKQKNTILCVERPSLGLMTVINNVSGFIFKEGSILSHISITLRERGIPSVISKDVFAKIKNGDTISIDNGKVTLIKKYNDFEEDNHDRNGI